MKLLKPVRQRISLLKLLWKISVSLGLIAFIICFALYFEFYGFDTGYKLAEESYAVSMSDIKISSHGARIYEAFGNMYKYCAVFFAMFLIGKFLEIKSDRILEMKIIFQVVCFSFLGLILYQLRQMFFEKGLRSQTTFWEQPFDSLIYNSVPYDWLCFFITLILLIIQIIIPFLYFYKNRKIA